MTLEEKLKAWDAAIDASLKKDWDEFKAHILHLFDKKQAEAKTELAETAKEAEQAAGAELQKAGAALEG
jgi:hypothetical protein